MKSFVSLIVAGLLCVAAVGAQAQESPFKFDFPGLPPAAAPQAKVLDTASLKTMLTDLGYQPEQLGVAGGFVAFKITLQHADGTRTSMAAIDPATGNVVLVGGGFASAPDVGRATTTWYRKLAKINNALSPRTIFINDSDVLGMSSVKANVNLTAEDLKKMIADHVSLFDQHVAPLAAELPSGAPVASR